MLSCLRVLSVITLLFIAIADYSQAEQCYWQDNICTDYGYIPPVRPARHPHSGNWWMEADLLYWKTCETGIACANTNKEHHKGSSHDEIKKHHLKVHGYDFDWDSAFRLGLGYNMASDGYDMAIYWTRFNTTATEHISAHIVEEGIALIGRVVDPIIHPYYTNSDYANAADKVSGRLNIDLNVFDFELGRECFLSRDMSFRPFIGVRGALVNQDMHVKAATHRVHLLGAIHHRPIFDFVEDVKLRNNYKGVGLRSGFDTEWYLGFDFSIYAQAAMSLLYGEHDIHYSSSKYSHLSHSGGSSSDSSDFDHGHFISGNHLNDCFCACRAISDLALGIRWQVFCNDPSLHLQFGWEQHKFFRLSHFESPSRSFDDTVDEASIIDQGDLCFQGIVLSAKYDF